MRILQTLDGRVREDEALREIIIDERKGLEGGRRRWYYAAVEMRGGVRGESRLGTAERHRAVAGLGEQAG